MRTWVTAAGSSTLSGYHLVKMAEAQRHVCCVEIKYVKDCIRVLQPIMCGGGV